MENILSDRITSLINVPFNRLTAIAYIGMRCREVARNANYIIIDLFRLITLFLLTSRGSIAVTVERLLIEQRAPTNLSVELALRAVPHLGIL